MMGKTHLIVSGGVTVSVLGLYGAEITLPVLAVTAISALLPDIDEPNALLLARTLPNKLLRILQAGLIIIASFIYFGGKAYAPWHIVLAALVGIVSFMPGRSLRKLIMFLIGIVCLMLDSIFAPWHYIIGCTLMMCAVVPHRGITHTIYAPIGWAALLYATTRQLDPNLWLAGGISYLIHVIPCDAVTNQGIRPLPPLKWRLRLKWVSTGKWTGTLVETTSILLTILLVWYVFFRGQAIVLV